MMYEVAKDTRLNLRITPQFRNDLQALADYRGLTLSSLTHSLLVRAVRQEKLVEPEAFTESERKVNSRISGIPVAPKSKSAGIPLKHDQRKKNNNKKVA